MSDTIIRRRKRSAAAGLTAVGAMAMLSGCEPQPDNEQISRQRYGAPTEVAAFDSVAECKASGAFAAVTCNEAAEAAAKEDPKTAPRYAEKNLCEDQFGNGNCFARSDGGSSFFTPLLTGFMIGRLLDGPGYRYSGLYRDRRSNTIYTGGGAWLFNGGYGGRGYGYQVGSRAVTAPVTTQRIQTRSSVVSRGGFGGRVSARSGGWGGGGRSFGG
ncbi:DUF1190 domain-containing protein [Sphingomonadaceae bacterium OTU29THOMA1]|nr:DUF1190 domain-containing protein [Sphingomonadaceae bacterium OTU29LAMAA1]USU13724.1 DUF1190 domain-containing protein [Sphingomonadaceae bacterium OTU29THOMA1]